MSELRGIPRWSKTAGIVMLVVFGLVLLTAIFGLFALSEKQEADLTRARQDALTHAAHLLQDVRNEVQREVEGAVRRAGEARDAQALRALLVEAPEALVQEVYHLDASDRVGWVEGPAWMRVPDNVFADVLARQDAQRESRARELVEQARALEGDPIASLERWIEVGREFSIVTRPLAGEGLAYPLGASWGAQMLARAVEALRSEPERALPAARRALLCALEIESLNRGRADVSRGDLVAHLAALAREVDALLGALPAAERESASAEVALFRLWRDRVQRPSHLRPLVAVARQVRDLEAEGRAAASVYVVREDPELVGVATVVPGREHRVVRLDAGAVRSLVERAIAQAPFSPLGMAPRVLDLAQDAPDGAGPPLPLGRPPVDLPFRMALIRVGDPVRGGMGDPQTAFYWALIGVAALGMAVAGYFLVRLLTREIHLARLKADFVSNLSHELKTPITSIALFTEMLRDGKLSRPEEQEEAFGVLHQECQRLQGIVQRMLDVARRTTRSVPYSLKPGDLNRLVVEAAGRFRRIVVEPGLDLRLSLAPEPLPVLMDPAAMDDAVTNLLSNAWKYRRGDKARVEVSTQRRGGAAEIVVSDDGVGIARSERKRVFEMFYRSDPLLSQGVPGTGLGLSLVRGIVRAHGGRIRVESGDGGVGTRFRLRFPLGHPSGLRPQADAPSASDLAHNGGPGPAAAAQPPLAPARAARPTPPGNPS
jgi:two-component system phosphate regulon sensor histidine kinase PhoR